ncbi:MAG: PIN domain-containing protein [Actinobacteria bacterium]|nr:PIN domain-containing protein [Actinomycetota bacterium]
MSAEARSFVDTNVLVYAHDATAGTKRDQARAIVRELWESGGGCLSVQVLQEFFVTVTRKIPHPLDARTGATAVEDFSRWTTHAPGAGDVIAAIELHERHDLSFWDAMIVQSAAALGCDVLYSEDLNAGQRYEDVHVVDPFA